MYLSASLAVDPSQVTKIRAIPPTKIFKKILFTLSSGQISEKEEVETLTALSILQQFNMVFRSLGITNIVRLAKDDVNLYFDEEGKTDDLAEAMEKFKFEVDEIESEVFQTLDLVLEHADAHFNYLIEITVRRIHKLSEPPIHVRINGAIKQLTAASAEEAEKKLAPIFKTNDAYQAFVRDSKTKFNQFVGTVDMAIRKAIKIDGIKTESNAKIVRPKERTSGPTPAIQHHVAEPVFYGYPGWSDHFMYAWMWSSLSHSHNVHIHDSTIVDETGANVMSVGENGFNAGESNALNVDAPFETPHDGDIQYYGDNQYAEDIQQTDMDSSGGDETRNAFADDSSAYSDFSDSSDSGSDAGSDSGSSCSSCSSCGGGD
ncbi:hypothetical protein K1X84_14915 [bacterium]|nr:hypothetical protein [bacterium]